MCCRVTPQISHCLAQGRTTMKKTFDYIVVGGGSGGCVVAGRLSEDPDVSVCLLEAGGGGQSSLVNIPAAMVAMVPTSVNNWAFDTVPQMGLEGRKGYQPRGKALGGSSAINAMIYVRGHQWDYDHWAALGNTGWGVQGCLAVLPSQRTQRAHRQPLAWAGRAVVGQRFAFGQSIPATFSGGGPRVRFAAERRLQR